MTRRELLQLIDDLADHIATVAPGSSAWADEGGLADRCEAAHVEMSPEQKAVANISVSRQRLAQFLADETIELRVPISAEMSRTGEPRWAVKPIDTCVAPAVALLNEAGIYTSGSCCGHGRTAPEIRLHLSVCRCEDLGTA